MPSSHWSDVFEDILRSSLPLDLPAERPVYLTTAGEAGGNYQQAGIIGYWRCDLDFQLRPLLERQGRWKGPGYASIVVRDSILAHKDIERPLAHFIHELAHGIELQNINVFRSIAETNQHEAQRIVELIGPVTPDLFTADSFVRPEWESHEARWIRTVLHLVHRTMTAGHVTGWLLDSYMSIAGDGYGLSHRSDYRRVLRDELNEQYDVPILNILKTPAPPAFEDLWRTDTQSLMVLK